jgi:hypothetical protein
MAGALGAGGLWLRELPTASCSTDFGVPARWSLPATITKLPTVVSDRYSPFRRSDRRSLIPPPLQVDCGVDQRLWDLEQLLGQGDKFACRQGTSTAPTIQADGYISKPLSGQDVLARVKSALGAVPIGEERAGPQLLCFEGYTLDTGGRTCVDASGEEVALTRAEFSLLLALGRQPGRVLSRDEVGMYPLQ